MRLPDKPLTDLDRLRAAYWEHIQALVAKYPAQEQNLPHYRSLHASARLGVMTRKIESKGALSTYARGDVVLVWGHDGDPHMRDDARTVWHPRNSIATIVDADRVKEI